MVAKGMISFFFMAEWYSVVCMYHMFFIHSCVKEHLGCFHVLATVNCPAMNPGVHVSFQIRVFIFSGDMLRNGIAGSYSIFRFFKEPP